MVDDEQSIRRLAEKELAAGHRRIITAGTAQDALHAFKKEAFDVVILDMSLPDGNGLDLMAQFQEMRAEIQIIIITGYGDIDSAVQAMKMGAYDFITKPFSLDRLELVIEKAYQRVCLYRENRQLRQFQSAQPHRKLIGHSEGMATVRHLIDKVAPTHVPVLITGESGTGKNVVAQRIHSLSLRREQPLITKNCGTLQRELMRSELFGHRKGAFTGADAAHEGLLSIAHKGSLFLDEIGELSMEVQSALLRALETQTFRRVGDKDEKKVDIRFIFATNQNLKQAVESGRFSQALYYRLNVFTIHLPPLRERQEDIPAIVEYFLGRLSTTGTHFKISDRAMQCLLSYDWPGNVRELQNVMERAMILSDGDLITDKYLPKEMVDNTPSTSTNYPFLQLKTLEKAHIAKVLAYCHGSRSRAAEALGIGRKTLYRKLKEYDMDI
jgi:two-component system NtrC family response regulator